MSKFKELPYDCIGVIFTYVNLIDLANMRYVCKEWNEVIMDTKLEKNIIITPKLDIENKLFIHFVKKYEKLNVITICDFEDEKMYDPKELPLDKFNTNFRPQNTGYILDDINITVKSLKCYGHLTEKCIKDINDIATDGINIDLSNTTILIHNHKNDIQHYIINDCKNANNLGSTKIICREECSELFTKLGFETKIYNRKYEGHNYLDYEMFGMGDFADMYY
jgi:hypothetical protein